MALMKAITYVEREGKITIPKNIRRETGISEKELVEMRVVGTEGNKCLVITKRKTPGRK